MRAPIRQIVLLAVALASTAMGSSAKPEAFKVIPGPGMPSLESIGLTSADLFNKTFVDELLAPPPFLLRTQSSSSEKPAGRLLRRWTSRCDEAPPFGINEGINACAAYLSALRTTDCLAGNKPVTMCTSLARGFETHVRGISIRPGSATSYCRDAALGVSWVPKNCKPGCEGDYCYSAGSAAANGNGDLIMLVEGNHK
ncbi:hypothetical protein C8A00DRAFT_35566 [Chaetomidium leptoderma]|uniref:Uncharacterized protein n=1 Tax=Chaetomidium leptoderma TaxID=669021 RepID=A0AAN6VK99_9PEZI|nr:hypothetical protein C8A00DRAFT_35566 [Chaetomidium leptoderma]